MLAQFLVLVLVWVLTRVFWKRYKYDLHKIPSPPGLPILGHTFEFADGGKNFARWFRSHHRKLGCPKAIKFGVGPDTWVFITDPICVKTEVNHKTDPIPRHPIMMSFAAPLISNQGMKETLMVTNKKTYSEKVRKAYLTGLQQAQLGRNFPKMDSLMDTMIRIIEAKRKYGPIDFQTLCVKFTLDTIGLLAMETNLGGLDGSRSIYRGIIDTGIIGIELMTNPLLKAYCKLFPNSEKAMEVRRVADALKEEWTQLTDDILERPDPPEGDMPIWHNLRSMIDPETNAPLPYDMLRSELATVVLGGMDTTGHQLSWILAMLATHPDITTKLFTELTEHNLCGPNSKEITMKVLRDLPYLNAVMKEGIRITDIVPFGAPRLLNKDKTLLGYRLPKGTIIAFPGNRAMNTEADWGDPDVVRPERWLTNEDMTAKYHDMYQSGPRSCPGRSLTQLELRLAIAKLVSRYHFSSEKSFAYLLENTLDGASIEAAGGIWLHVTPRKFEEQD